MKRRRAFIVDLNKCTGCHACEMACQIANDVPAERRWRHVRTFNELHVHDVEVAHLSLACNHCASAPCMEGCPARAFRRDETTGAVLIDQAKCIGCRYCSWACPYGAPRFDEERGVMAKCDFCAERQHSGGKPACVTGCPTGALDWGELRDDELAQDAPGIAASGAITGMADAGAGPAIRLVELNPPRRAPRQTEPPALPPWKALADRLVPHITLAHEWTLAVFTLLLSVLVGLFLASRLGAPAPNAVLFLIVGAAGLLLSASHLGHKTRAWRAALHPDRSWLSREIVLSIAFLASAWLALSLGSDAVPGRSAGPSHSLAWLAAICGLSALFSAEGVYRVATIRGSGIFHSAHLVGTALLLAAVWSGSSVAGVLLAGIKALLYGFRKRNRLKLGLPARNRATALRLGLLAAGGVAAWWGAPLAVVFILLSASELIDRTEYYDELEIPTPESLMLDELGSRPQISPVFIQSDDLPAKR